MQIFSSNSAPVSDQMSFRSKSEADNAPKSAQQQVLKSLAPNLSEAQLQGVLNADASDFSAEKVSARVVDFVAAGLAAAANRGASPERLEELYQSAMKGVEKGFAEAKAILEDMPMYTSEVRALVEDTEKMTFEKLAGIAPGAQSAEIVESTLEAQAQYRESLMINLVTQDGDRIQVKFANTEKIAFASQGDSWALSSSSSSQYQLKIKGELDEGEMAAIKDLLEKVSDVADQFYSGKVDQAFDLASELKMDPNELARFDLNMQMSSRVEVKQYQTLSEDARPERSLANRIQNWLGPVDALGESPALDQFTDRANVLKQLLEGAIDVGGKEPGVPLGLQKLLLDRLT